MESCLSRDFSEEELEDIRLRAIDWALAHGISMRPSNLSEDQDKVVHAPFTLFPTTIPESNLQQATKSMVYFSRLMHHVAMDHQLLQESFKHVIETDEFSNKLWQIYLQIKDDNKVQPVSLGLFRNDFMLDEKKDSPGNETTFQIKQIEFNSIASSFGGLVSQQYFLHRYIVDFAGEKNTEKQMPYNRPVEGLVTGLIKAWELYQNKQAVILFLVSHNERNVMDQRFLEYEIYKQNKHIKVIRKTFDDLVKNGKLAEDRKYFINKEEVGVVYYRVGYAPTDYTDKIWTIRLELEKAWCIKCPPIQYQLVGAKKIQQVLAKPGILDKYISDISIKQLIQSTFAGQYSLDIGEEGDKALNMAVNNPDQFVLKPQREGGGYNMYDEEMKNFLEVNRASQERAGYILMEKVRPKPQVNYLIKAGIPFVKSLCISELGIYGCYIGNKNEEIYNENCGHLLRTKTADTNEGGVCAGFSGIDTPFLIPQ
ncbi:glutathione synthetase [Patella vulgata]|uniref:glutathione synthetase n=1 Tax=Patella vulgata TaxID=6465 RepID=UPI0024A85056|nr:glutathione synthetase [Patella vulgata]XP_050395899.2 glutathione synthetase [Patella vulgata]